MLKDYKGKCFVGGGGDKTFELFIVLHWHHILPFHYHIQWSVTNDLSS